MSFTETPFDDLAKCRLGHIYGNSFCYRTVKDLNWLINTVASAVTVDAVNSSLGRRF